jgi:hypothetical protein
MNVESLDGIPPEPQHGGAIVRSDLLILFRVPMGASAEFVHLGCGRIGHVAGLHGIESFSRRWLC